MDMAKLQEHTTRRNQRVEIKADCTAVYPLARAYMQGWIRQQDHDPLGYPMVYIEWDRNHWAYSGEQDGWTMEAHFNPVQEAEEMSDDPNNFDDLENALYSGVSRALDEFMDRQKKPDTETPKAPETPAESEGVWSEPENEHAARLSKAIEVLGEAEGFLVLVALKEQLGDREMTVPAMVESGSEDSLALLRATASEIGSQAHLALMLKTREGAA